ncbi:hypothetical protein RZS08_51695, partial [Arthrospira platensis SPKY1]|nr:hypothetical protein [Arthrospira platensis SPKY1]
MVNQYRMCLGLIQKSFLNQPCYLPGRKQLNMKNLLMALLMLGFANQGLTQTGSCANPSDAYFLKGIWVGEFTQYSCGIFSTYPMTIEINSIDGKKFSGYFIWKDLPSSP